MKKSEAKEEIRKLLHKIVELDNDYVLDGRYVRWGAVQRDINAIIDSIDLFDLAPVSPLGSNEAKG